MAESCPPRLRALAVVARHCQHQLRRPLFGARWLTPALVLLIAAWAVAANPATITFSLDFPSSDPEHYFIAVNSSGHARYECSARVSPDSDERQTYETEFELSPANQSRIFDLAAQVQYFSKKLDSGNGKLAFTGAKKLRYEGGGEIHTAEYNYSNIAAVQQLTEIFQSIASTMEYGRRLTYYHRYQKLALDDELKRMEAQATNNELRELQAAEPVLKQLYEDTTVLNVVRARAQRLIEMGKSRAGASH